jgi:hypothetical protein
MMPSTGFPLRALAFNRMGPPVEWGRHDDSCEAAVLLDALVRAATAG